MTAKSKSAFGSGGRRGPDQKKGRAQSSAEVQQGGMMEAGLTVASVK